jgi:hypothetical protein
MNANRNKINANNEKEFFFSLAFIGVMHTDVRMPWAHGGAGAAHLRFLFLSCCEVCNG